MYKLVCEQQQKKEGTNAVDKGTAVEKLLGNNVCDVNSWHNDRTPL